jgi:hypothetical protein
LIEEYEARQTENALHESVFSYYGFSDSDGEEEVLYLERASTSNAGRQEIYRNSSSDDKTNIKMLEFLERRSPQTSRRESIESIENLELTGATCRINDRMKEVPRWQKSTTEISQPER